MATQTEGMCDTKYVQLYNGYNMPIIGLGTWQGKTHEMHTAVKTALHIGYRHIDAAFAYRNEKAIGDALKEVFAEGIIKREDVFVVTKLPPNALRAEDVERFLRMSLDNLQLTYVDMYLIHTPVGFKYISDMEIFPYDSEGNIMVDTTTDLLAVWKKMEHLVDIGLAKSIGVSNFATGQIERILKNCRIKPANLQVECHAYFQQKQMLEFCQKHDITLCAYSPIGSPGTFSSATGESGGIPVLINDPVLKPIAEKYKKTASQILLRWLTQRGIVVIPKSTNPQRIKENFSIFDFQLTDEDMKAINKMDKHLRMLKFNYKGVEKHPEYVLWSEEDERFYGKRP